MFFIGFLTKMVIFSEVCTNLFFVKKRFFFAEVCTNLFFAKNWSFFPQKCEQIYFWPKNCLFSSSGLFFGSFLAVFFWPFWGRLEADFLGVVWGAPPVKVYNSSFGVAGTVGSYLAT